jgi:hypothetical protein
MTQAEGMSHDAFMAALLARGAHEKSSRGLSGLVICKVLPRFNGRPVQAETDAVVRTSGDQFLQRDKARKLSLRSHEFIPVAA